MDVCNLPDDLTRLPAVALQGDPDGEIERAAFALLPHDVVGSARLALTIQNRFRREAWLRGFRQCTLDAALVALVRAELGDTTDYSKE